MEIIYSQKRNVTPAKAVENLKKLDMLYLNADIRHQRDIIGSLFPEKWFFDGLVHRTEKLNEAALIIYLINNKLVNKKAVSERRSVPITALYS